MLTKLYNIYSVTPTEVPTDVPTVYPTCVPEIIKFSCPVFCANNTDCARRDTSNCDISLCEGDILVVTTGCCFRDTYIRLFLDDVQVAYNDDSTYNSCPYCEHNHFISVKPNLMVNATSANLVFDESALLLQLFRHFHKEDPFQFCSLLFFQVPKKSCGCRKYQLRSGCFENELW